MVASTAQGIRYPQVGDRPCDLPEHLCAMAADIDALLALHDDALERTRRPPTVMLRLSTPTAMINSISTPTSFVGDPIPFDSVETQWGGTFVRLGVSRSLFRMPRTGIYQVGLSYFMARAYDTFSLSLALDGQWAFNLIKYPTTLEPVKQQHADRLSTDVEGTPGDQGSLSGLIRVTSTSDYYFWSLYMPGAGGSFDATQIMLGARAYAFWTADL